MTRKEQFDALRAGGWKFKGWRWSKGEHDSLSFEDAWGKHSKVLTMPETVAQSLANPPTPIHAKPETVARVARQYPHVSAGFAATVVEMLEARNASPDLDEMEVNRPLTPLELDEREHSLYR